MRVLGLRTPMGFAAVRMASEAILKVRDMVRTLRPVGCLAFRTLDCDGHCNSAVTRKRKGRLKCSHLCHLSPALD
jgi:hypothetical protein